MKRAVALVTASRALPGATVQLCLSPGPCAILGIHCFSAWKYCGRNFGALRHRSARALSRLPTGHGFLGRSSRASPRIRLCNHSHIYKPSHSPSAYTPRFSPSQRLTLKFLESRTLPPPSCTPRFVRRMLITYSTHRVAALSCQLQCGKEEAREAQLKERGKTRGHMALHL